MPRSRTALAAAAALLLAPAIATAQSPSVPGRVPARAIMAVSVKNPKVLYTPVKDSPLESTIDRIGGQIMAKHSPSWARFHREADGMASNMQAPLGLRGLFLSALRGFDYYLLEPESPGAPADWALVVLYNSSMAGDGVVNTIKTEAMKADPEGVREEAVGTGTLTVMPRESLAIAVVASIRCIASSERAAREVLNARDNDELTKSDTFDQVMWGLAEEEEAPAWFYADGPKLRAAAQAGSVWFLPPSSAASVPDVLGGQIRTTATGFQFRTATPHGMAPPDGSTFPVWQERFRALGLNVALAITTRTAPYGTVSETTLTFR
jgi:hypothetical protein